MCQNDAPTRPAWLPSTVGLHIASQHADSGKIAGDPASRGWNNANTGAFVGWQLGRSQIAGLSLSHQLVAGGFLNSRYKRSHYVAIDTTAPLAQTRIGTFGAALSMGAMSGYDRMTGEYFGGPVPAGQRVEGRCTPATGCRPVLLKDIIAPAIVPGIDYTPAFKLAPTLRLSYLHDSGGTGSKAVHLTSRWIF
jgi:hypothetical protein